ncbi:hypothetical protein MOV61_22090 [Neorhizobium sp. BETTINA12A]|uniref:hypothetical protein n=1 Tax=Neorhizobium sp. BETTINA12A TaxID=2908924 RepID=UPI001FF4567D|nr:hypothetical protein [Neorhizobium sp. BETTINA12A]MCJ9753415.1 hypothetical protein [Neorhizobium sp. BETTINA12A]
MSKFKGVILIGFLVIAAGFAAYNVIIHGMVYVKRDGWRTYEEAPVAFVVTTLASAVMLVALAASAALIIWLGMGKRDRPFKGPPVPLVEETHISEYKAPSSEGNECVKSKIMKI